MFEMPDGLGDAEYSITLPSLKRLMIEDRDELRDAEFINAIFRNTTMPALQALEVHCSEDINGGAIRRGLRERSPLLCTVELNGSSGDLEGDEEESSIWNIRSHDLGTCRIKSNCRLKSQCYVRSTWHNSHTSDWR